MEAMTGPQLRTLAKQKRLAALDRWRSMGSDREFGIEVQQRKQGHSHRLVWTVERDPFLALMALDRLRSAALPAFEVHLVEQCRRAGIGWDQIAWALNVTRQTLQKRYPSLDSAVRQGDSS